MVINSAPANLWQCDVSRLTYMKGANGRMYVRTYVRTVDDVMAIKPNFLASMGYQYFLSYGARRARGPLSYIWIYIASSTYHPHNDLLPVVLIAQLIGHCTGIVNVWCRTPNPPTSALHRLWWRLVHLFVYLFFSPREWMPMPAYRQIAYRKWTFYNKMRKQKHNFRQMQLTS